MEVVELAVVEENLKPFAGVTVTGDWEEWHEEDENGVMVNKKCSNLTKDDWDNYSARLHNGRVFSTDGGKTWFVNENSGLPLDFPCELPSKPKKFVLSHTGLVEVSGKEASDFLRNGGKLWFEDMGSYLTFEHYYGEPKVFVTTEPFPMYEDEEPQRGQTMFALEKVQAKRWLREG
ncbi:hypothetical protein [Bacillus thuringiensis]|uniref:hypothetical protein n=1 Tax=Bacillus thuringiensis TaxID=1428 RepID=UPI002DBF7615|nr:hypothetical protein [Bacillus thuringiensis]MEC3459774.1 hypothetical protein [Bacillus thuringiensis]